MFRTRLISGIVLVVLAILLVTKGGVLLYCVTAAISLIGMFELYRVLHLPSCYFTSYIPESIHPHATQSARPPADTNK